MRCSVLLLALLAWLAGGCIAQAEQPAAAVIGITIDGVRQNILILTPAVAPTVAVVMFPGGDGRIGIDDSGRIARPGNFLIRTREQWLAQGFMFVAVDAAPARVGRSGDRVGPENVRAIAAIVQAVRRRSAVPIWLVGTSAGAPAAVAGAAGLPKGSISGVVISSPVSVAGPRDSVFDVTLARITVPVLIQIHQHDGCRLTPPGNAALIKAALKAAPVVAVQSFSGGSWPRSGPCEAFAPHGFFGIEPQVVTAAADWIRAH